MGGNHITNAVIDYKFAAADKKSNLPDFIEDLDNESFDFAMVGEGELPMVGLIDAIAEPKPYEKVPA